MPLSMPSRVSAPVVDVAAPSTPRAASSSHSRRKSSLCLTHPINIPIPPSLISSPHLQQNAMFAKYSPVHAPSKQDEDWLGDTVPLATNGTHDDDARGVLGKKPGPDTAGFKGAVDEKHGASFAINHRGERAGRSYTPTPKISTTSPPLVHRRAQYPPSTPTLEGYEH